MFDVILGAAGYNLGSSQSGMGGGGMYMNLNGDNYQSSDNSVRMSSNL